MKPIIHCLFEQSGTFKNAFKSFGYEAFDYDILDDFDETDFKIDLFNEITNAYDYQPSIFDTFYREDLILAFFPCTRFENQINLLFKGVQFQDKNLSDIDKLERCIRLSNERNYLYGLITKLVIVALRKGLKLVIENPYSTQHYLTRYWCLEPKFIDFNRLKRGDNYVKPTQYWFINCEPAFNIVWKALEVPNTKPKKIVNEGNKVKKSLITQEYAKRFIEEFLLTKEHTSGII